MPTPRLLLCPVMTLALAAVCGCGGTASLVRHAEVTCEAVAADARRRSAPTPVERGGDASLRQTLYFAPRDGSAGAGEAPGGAEPTEPAGVVPFEEAEAREPFASIKGRSLREVVADDLRAIPRRVARGMKHTYTRPENLIILGAAFGADRIVRHNLDGDIRDDLRNDDTSLAETGDFGTIIGNPALHFGIAGAWYLTSVHGQDQANYARSRTLIQALLVNGLSTTLLKVSMDDESPNDEEWGWPSGHASSSMCFASVMHAYYGWKAGVPLYLLAGYSAATRIEDREHDLSDVVFGTTLGLVVGHSVVKGELPEVAGFQVLPYGGRNAGGLMLMKRW